MTRSNPRHSPASVPSRGHRFGPERDRRRQRMARAWLAAMLLVGVVPAGCNPTKPEPEVSAASSGFKPADGAASKPTTKSSPAVADTASSIPPAAAGSTKPQANSDAVANAKPPAAPAGDNQGPQPAPTLPSFTPGQVDPSIAGKSYMKLEMTQSQDPEELLRFIGLIDRSMQEMQQDVARRLLNFEQAVDRGMAVARMKLTASERLVKVAKTPEETSKGLIGKLEALGQMAQFKDVPSADELRIVAKDLAKSDDPKVASQARRMQLLNAVNDFRNQGTGVNDLMEIAEDLLAKTENPDPSVFMAVAQVAQALDQSVGSELQDGKEPNPEDPRLLAVDKLVNLLEAKFRDVPNPQLGMSAWQMKMQRLPDFEKYLQVLDTRQAMSADPDAVAAAAQELMDKIPSPWTSMAMIQVATQFEYSGNVPLAKKLLEIAAIPMGAIQTPELREQIDIAMKGFDARTGIIGKPLPIEGLVDTAGKAFDMADYKGKVVLVDFWATWCGPCIAEIPNIQKVFDAKHAEGFEVLSINLDDKRADLDAFLLQQKASWPVYVSSDPNKSGMDSPLAQSLAITAIPFTILIGRDGNVAAVHVRGKALEPKVQELLTSVPKSE